MSIYGTTTQMRLHFGGPPGDASFSPESEGWTRLREPSPIGLQLLAVPVAIVTLLLLVPAWRWCAPSVFDGMGFTIQMGAGDEQASKALGAEIGGLLLVLFGVGLLIAVHELLHAMTFPKEGKTFIGVWPMKLLFYAAYHGTLSRNRFLLVMIVPFLVLTIVPLLAAALMRTSHGLIAVASILNGAFACGDLVGIALIAAQVPSDAELRNQGWATWWRIKAESGCSGMTNV